MLIFVNSGLADSKERTASVQRIRDLDRRHCLLMKETMDVNRGQSALEAPKTKTESDQVGQFEDPFQT